MFTSGYITMQEAVEATPLSYLVNRALLPNLLQILLLFLVVLFDPYILKKQRRKMCGGTLTITSAPREGTCVSNTIPKGANAP